MCRILAIDDDEMVLMALGCIIESWGCQVITAASTEEALGRLGTGVDAIVADYRLRGDDTGLAAIRAIYQKQGRVVPSVIITGDTAGDRLAQLQESGVAIRHKPVMPNDLWKVLSEQLADTFKVFKGPPSRPQRRIQ